jgi:hypothetical protein
VTAGFKGTRWGQSNPPRFSCITDEGRLRELVPKRL